MQARRPLGLTPLSIVLPHPALPRRKSSLLSLVPSPRTPRSSPTCSSIFFAGAANRKSTDSWNSSNQDLADDLDYDWKPDQILLLRRTLDALPPHLMTPFNGPIPPSNLLDKIARGVTQAKGEDWPHSLRATRVKLIELARTMAEEDSKPRKSIPEESDMDYSDYPTFAEGDVLQQTTNLGTTGLGIGISLGPRRPLYRQSSMDFLNTSDLQDNEAITRLSTRLQKADRFIPNSSYHPYSRGQIPRRSSSPPRPSQIPSLISPSTPSTSTLSSLASLSTAGSHPRVLRRSASTISSSSTTSNSRMSLSSAGGLPPIAADPRVQRVRRSESFCGPSAPKDSSSRKAVKRAPSYGTLAQESRDKTSVDISVPEPSSDEEEKMRTRRAKKPRMRSESMSTSSPPMSPSPAPSPSSSTTRSPIALRATASPASKRNIKSKASVKAPETQAVANAPEPGSERPKRMNAKRNPSMFGAELPRLPSTLQHPETPATSPTLLSAAPLLAPKATEKVKTLRRVRRLPPARRISFGSLIPPVGEDGHEADMEELCEEEGGLGSAFQLR
ncbi:hypothetical protein C8F04DRAFT_1113429 [Mycena alexandri]|uniref:Uncharacterized protein n=1 Tax=Mycena alexandri TaxID=1745969 RepID=A0AAD6SMW1_9AGAR|nr:hypothetical protein C8F04DRAFT_1113429 [Mycena alexandri]